MSRSGYRDDCDDGDGLLGLYRYRGQVASAIRGRRGQALLRELAEALDAMPNKRLISDEFWNGEACALGVLAVKRGMDVISIETDEYDHIAELFGVARQLVCEIEFENDECAWGISPEARWHHIRGWVRRHLKTGA